MNDCQWYSPFWCDGCDCEGCASYIPPEKPKEQLELNFDE